MKLLDTIPIITAGGAKRLELYHGDLTNMRSSVDLLILSASPREYIPTPGSLIAALHRKGVVVAQLAMTKELELRDTFSCWLSREIESPHVGIRFKRILCVEPRHFQSVSELARGFFQALIAVLSSTSNIRTAAMPVVFSGGAGLPVAIMVQALIDGAVHWMALGLPLDCLKIVVYNEAEALEAAETFSRRKPQYATTPFGSRAVNTHDFFISYAHANEREAEQLVEYLRQEKEGIRLFVDRETLRTGGIWQHQLFMALDSCHKVVTLLSPEYVASDFCIEEFNIAMYRSRSEGQEILAPIYMFSGALPTYMLVRQFSDCREGDIAKLKTTCRNLVKELEAEKTGENLRDKSCNGLQPTQAGKLR